MPSSARQFLPAVEAPLEVRFGARYGRYRAHTRGLLPIPRCREGLWFNGIRVIGTLFVLLPIRLVAYGAIARLVVRRLVVRRLGANGQEMRAAYPLDELIPEPALTWTIGRSLEASAEEACGGSSKSAASELVVGTAST